MTTANGFAANLRSLNRRVTGVERYTAEVSSRLGGFLRPVSPARQLPPAAGHLWEQFVLPQRLHKGELLWSPANIGPLSVSNQVLTLHDTSVLEHPEWFHPLFARWYQAVLPRLVRRVRRILTVSEHSRGRILKLFNLPQEKVTVIPEGVNPNQFQPASLGDIQRVRQHYGIKGDYLFFLGTLEPRKNLSRMVEAWRLIQPEHEGTELIIAGSRASRFADVPSFSGAKAVHSLGYVAETDLPALYSGASASLLASLTEGFGLTALEAMACGTPVIAARAGALPETVDGAGLLIDPLEVSAWARAMHELLADEDCRQEYRQRGLSRARQFTWDRTAQGVRQELEAAGGTKPPAPFPRTEGGELMGRVGTRW